MVMAGRRKSIGLFIALCAGLISVTLLLYIGWVVLSWRTGILLFLGKMKIRLDVAAHGRELRIRGEDRVGGLALLHYFLGLFLIVPEIRRGDFGFDGG